MKNTKLNELFSETVGWIGVLSLLLAYGLLSFDVVAPHDLLYHVLNLIGGTGIIIDAVADRNWQPAALNVVWIGIALYSISTVIF